MTVNFRSASDEAGFAPGPWEYNDHENFKQPHGKFSDVAVYAAGNAFPWRMCEVSGPTDKAAIATAKLIAAAPNLFHALTDLAEAARNAVGQRADPALTEALAEADHAIIIAREGRAETAIAMEAAEPVRP